MLLRAPIALYRCRLGWLLGHRFLLLTHIGRKTGVRRRTVLEVMRCDERTGACFVGSGWGERADWYKNIQKNPNVEITVAARKSEARARWLSPAESEREFRRYADRHPKAMKQLARVMTGRSYSGSDEDFRLLSQSVPVFELLPVETIDEA